jgi:hypothetical protein
MQAVQAQAQQAKRPVTDNQHDKNFAVTFGGLQQDRKTRTIISNVTVPSL